MLKAKCDVCKQTIFVDSETGHRFDADSTDVPHKCGVYVYLYTDYVIKNKVKMDLGIDVRYNEGEIARMITAAAVNAGWDPYTCKVEKYIEFVVVRP